jgi:hypothetical protein
MVTMDDAALEAIGVAALGARRKMLKIFEVSSYHIVGGLPCDMTTFLGRTYQDWNARTEPREFHRWWLEISVSRSQWRRNICG